MEKTLISLQIKITWKRQITDMSIALRHAWSWEVQSKIFPLFSLSNKAGPFHWWHNANFHEDSASTADQFVTLLEHLRGEDRWDELPEKLKVQACQKFGELFRCMSMLCSGIWNWEDAIPYSSFTNVKEIQDFVMIRSERSFIFCHLAQCPFLIPPGKERALMELGI